MESKITIYVTLKLVPLGYLIQFFYRHCIMNKDQELQILTIANLVLTTAPTSLLLEAYCHHNLASKEYET